MHKQALSAGKPAIAYIVGQDAGLTKKKYEWLQLTGSEEELTMKCVELHLPVCNITRPMPLFDILSPPELLALEARRNYC